MSFTETNTITEQRIRFLDVTPMISALQFQPSDFEFEHGWLKHVPSHHRFRFGRKGEITIDAQCDCSGRKISREQGDRLMMAFSTWRLHYWQPLQVDREFADHFKTPGAWLRLFRDIRLAWRRFRRKAQPITIPNDAMAMVPAE